MTKTYATVEDLSLAWSGYDVAMEPQATKLLEYAAALIDQEASKAGVTPDDISDTVKESVSVDMVRMALLADNREAPDVKSHEEIAGPYTANISYFGAGGIWITDKQKSALGLDAQKVAIISPAAHPSLIGSRTCH